MDINVKIKNKRPYLFYMIYYILSCVLSCTMILCSLFRIVLDPNIQTFLPFSLPLLASQLPTLADSELLLLGFKHLFTMEAIKKKMQSMKIEKDNACDRVDVCDAACKAANKRAAKVGSCSCSCYCY